MDETGDGLPFAERQAFRQPWMWVLIIAMALATSGLMLFGLVQQLVLQRPFGQNPDPDSVLIGVAVIVTAFNALMIAFLWWVRLETRAEPDGIYIRFPPFLRRKIPYRNIKSAEARRYSALREYGGWGIRYGRSGKAYNVSGNEGVQLVLNTGERLLLGSQRANEFAAVINARLQRA